MKTMAQRLIQIIINIGFCQNRMVMKSLSYNESDFKKRVHKKYKLEFTFSDYIHLSYNQHDGLIKHNLRAI